MAATLPASLPDLERSTNGWMLTVEGYTDAAALGRVLWPNGVPGGVTVEVDMVVTEPARVGKFEITGLNLSTVQEMEPSWANWITYRIMIPEASDQMPPHPQPTEPAPSTSREEAESEWKSFFEESVHTVAEFASWFVDEESAFLTVFDGFADPIHYTILLFELFGAVIEAFQEELKDERQHGFLFGVIWEVMAIGTIEPTEDMATIPGMNTYEEHRQAFLEGVDAGRQWVRSSVESYNSVAARIAYRMVKDHSSADSAAQDTLTELAQAGGWTNWVELSLRAPQVR